MEEKNKDITKINLYDSQNMLRPAEVFFKFKYGNRDYCAAITDQGPYEIQVLGYGFDNEGEFFTYDIAEPLYRTVLNTFLRLYKADTEEVVENNMEEDSPILEVMGIGEERNKVKKAQALMFFSYGITDEKKHDYVLVSYLEPDKKGIKGAFYRYALDILDDGRHVIGTESIRNDMEYENVRAYFKKEYGEELNRLLQKESVLFSY